MVLKMLDIERKHGFIIKNARLEGYDASSLPCLRLETEWPLKSFEKFFGGSQLDAASILNAAAKELGILWKSQCASSIDGVRYFIDFCVLPYSKIMANLFGNTNAYTATIEQVIEQLYCAVCKLKVNADLVVNKKELDDEDCCL